MTWPRWLRHAAFGLLAVLVALHVAVALLVVHRTPTAPPGLAVFVLAFAALAIGAAWKGLVRREPLAIVVGFALLVPWSVVMSLAAAPPMFPDADEPAGWAWQPFALVASVWAIALAGAIGVAKDPTPARRAPRSAMLAADGPHPCGAITTPERQRCAPSKASSPTTAR